MFSKEYLEFPALILSVLHNLIQNTFDGILDAKFL